MLFTEPAFQFLFLPLLLAVYFAVPRSWRNPVLLAASLFFYAWGEKVFVFVMVASIAFNWAMGLGVGPGADPGAEPGAGPGAGRSASRRKILVSLAVAGNLLLLGVCKYSDFLVANLNVLLAQAGLAPLRQPGIELPIGISFFTFQAMSYVIDVYRGVTPRTRNPLDVALYIALFPQLIAGPIVRYHDVAQQIIARNVDTAKFASGIRRFIIGLAKKVIIANTLALPADHIFAADPMQLPAAVAWLGILCYSLQIYFDFSGYSDMAIGLGRMFGFEFLENFNYPYISRSITEFWRRWHISLSTWFRDYLYIPLGGNRGSSASVYRNLLVVFVLCGLWHGAAWTFLVWGLFHGSFLVLERLGLRRWLQRMPTLAVSAYTVLVFMVGWVFFRSESLGQAGEFLLVMTGLGHADGRVHHLDMYLNIEVLAVLLAGIIGATPVPAMLYRRGQSWALGEGRHRPKMVGGDAISSAGAATVAASAWAALELLLLMATLAYCIMLVAAGTYNPFIYFRF
ncbi:MAG: MBOAT family protein [Phycisphaeraceae bacterium]